MTVVAVQIPISLQHKRLLQLRQYLSDEQVGWCWHAASLHSVADTQCPWPAHEAHGSSWPAAAQNPPSHMMNCWFKTQHQDSLRQRSLFRPTCEATVHLQPNCITHVTCGPPARLMHSTQQRSCTPAGFIRCVAHKDLASHTACRRACQSQCGSCSIEVRCKHAPHPVAREYPPATLQAISRGCGSSACAGAEQSALPAQRLC